MNSKIYIGCSGFAEGLWKGVFYPKNLPSKEYFGYYASHLNGVEINSTFYRRPRPSTLQKWYDQSGADFKFFIKVHKYFTHNKRLLNVAEELETFCADIAGVLGDKLAGFLFQMPPTYRFTEENLQRVLTMLPDQYLKVIEFRHQSWWDQRVLQALQAKEILFCGVSFPKDIPDDVMINSDKAVYYRLHGVPQLFKSEYTAEELDALAEKVRNFKGDVYIFFNNTFGTAGIKNALYLQNILKRK